MAAPGPWGRLLASTRQQPRTQPGGARALATGTSALAPHWASPAQPGHAAAHWATLPLSPSEGLASGSGQPSIASLPRPATRPPEGDTSAQEAGPCLAHLHVPSRPSCPFNKYLLCISCVWWGSGPGVRTWGLGHLAWAGRPEGMCLLPAGHVGPTRSSVLTGDTPTLTLPSLVHGAWRPEPHMLLARQYFQPKRLPGALGAGRAAQRRRRRL